MGETVVQDDVLVPVVSQIISFQHPAEALVTAIEWRMPDVEIDVTRLRYGNSVSMRSPLAGLANSREGLLNVVRLVLVVGSEKVSEGLARLSCM